MPDPFQYLLAIAVAAGASALVALAFGGLKSGARTARTQAAIVLAMAAGLASGAYILRLQISWPPVNGLSRLLTIMLPFALAIEVLSSFSIVPPWFAWCWRLALAASAGRILLHDSVYVSGPGGEWSAWQVVAVLSIGGGMLALVWVLLTWLSRRSGGVSISLALAQAVLCGGLAVMLAGYVAGGAAALPVAGALVGCGAASGWRKLPGSRLEGVIGIGVVAFFGLLFIGRFFGQLSTARALALFLAPLLCWTTELPALRCQPAWRVAVLRLVLVGVPLVAVLVLAKRDFDRELLPLLAG